MVEGRERGGLVGEGGEVGEGNRKREGERTRLIAHEASNARRA